MILKEQDACHVGRKKGAENGKPQLQKMNKWNQTMGIKQREV